MRNQLLDLVTDIVQSRDEEIGKSEAIWLADGIISGLNLIQEVRHFGETTEYRYATPWSRA